MIVAASWDNRCQLWKSIGADATINCGGNTSSQAFRDAITEATCGSDPETDPRLPLNLTLLKDASLGGAFWGDLARPEPQNNKAMMDELLRRCAEGEIKPVIDSANSMAELKKASRTRALAASRARSSSRADSTA